MKEYYQDQTIDAAITDWMFLSDFFKENQAGEQLPAYGEDVLKLEPSFVDARIAGSQNIQHLKIDESWMA